MWELGPGSETATERALTLPTAHSGRGAELPAQCTLNPTLRGASWEGKGTEGRGSAGSGSCGAPGGAPEPTLGSAARLHLELPAGSLAENCHSLQNALTGTGADMSRPTAESGAEDCGG